MIYQIVSKTFQNYFNNSHARFQRKKKSDNFLKVLNDSEVQYTIEYEKNKKQLNFLNLTVITNQASK